MEIIVNGEKKIVTYNITILNYLISKRLKPENTIIEYNLQVLDKKLWAETFLKDGDRLEILNFVGGG